MDVPSEIIGRQTEWDRLREFAQSGLAEASLGVVWGRRRVGKSLLLQCLTEAMGGFYYEAIRGGSQEALGELGVQLAAYTGAPAPLALESWDAAAAALLGLGRDRETVVVLDEYPYLTEHSPELDSVLQRALGPRRADRTGSRSRLILCGSAITVMANLLRGSAALRGRAGMDLRVSPFDFRTARALHGIQDVQTALLTYAIIGGVAAYARDMVDGDLPGSAADFGRWVCRRVLSPAAPLFHEVGLLLSEDPVTARVRKINLYHAALAGIASGHHAHGKLTRYVKVSGASLAPILDSLAGAELIERCADPVRGNRPTYQPADPLIRFHYAVIRRFHQRFTRLGANTAQAWQEIQPTFTSQVVGPCFEAMARTWTQHLASADEVGGQPDEVGSTTLTLADGREMQVDVVAVEDASAPPGQRRVLCLGEAKSGELISEQHLRRLEAARVALGERARGARLLLFGAQFSQELAGSARGRGDVELVGLERLYG